MKTILAAFLIVFSSTILYAEGWLSVSPGYDAINGRGSEISLEIDQPIKDKLSLVGCTSFNRFETYRDLLGSVGFEIELSKRLTVGAGYSYDRFSSLDSTDAPFYSKNVYTRVKIRLWE